MKLGDLQVKTNAARVNIDNQCDTRAAVSDPVVEKDQAVSVTFPRLINDGIHMPANATERGRNIVFLEKHKTKVHG